MERPKIAQEMMQDCTHPLLRQDKGLNSTKALTGDDNVLKALPGPYQNFASILKTPNG